jgi:hypothetical protein
MDPGKQQLNIEEPSALREYLASTGLVASGEVVTIFVLPGGVSSRTVLVERPNKPGLVLKQSLAKLRVEADWFSDPIRIHREGLGLRWAGRLAPSGSVPALLVEDAQEHVLAMEAVPSPHNNWKKLLLGGLLKEEHVVQFARWLGTMHLQSWQRRHELAPLFDDRSFFVSLRVEPYYQYSASKVPAAVSFLSELVTTTLSRRLALVHGDYSPKNVLIHAGRLVVIDYEVIHWGDPAFDLGFALTHFLAKANHLRARRADFGRAAKLFFRQYLAELENTPWIDDLETHVVRHLLGCLLARVEGRSPLEYLAPANRVRQRDAVLRLMSCAPRSVDDLIDEFLSRLESPCP